MKIGFIIISHRTPDELFEKLLIQLDKFPNKQIVVHHDFSQADFSDELIKRFNLELSDTSYPTTWCSFTVVKATFDCIKKCKDADWIILLSANDYPIKDAQTITEFLTQTTYNAFMEGRKTVNSASDLPLANWTYDTVFKKTLFRLPLFDKKGHFKWKPVKVNRSSPSFNESYHLFFGSQWFMIDKQVAGFLNTIDTENSPVVSFLSTAEKCKDEIIFQTLVHNEKRFKISTDSHRFIDWTNSKNWHPNVVTMQHWRELKTSHALFARKFDNVQSWEVIQRIDNEILNK